MSRPANPVTLPLIDYSPQHFLLAVTEGDLRPVSPAATSSVGTWRTPLVIIITNFRDEDSSELGYALRLLRSRHLVMLASLRERIVGELMSQPLTCADAMLDIASAHLYEQSRRDAFNKLADRGPLTIDAEPDQLGVQLVNRYHAVKRAGMI